MNRRKIVPEMITRTQRFLHTMGKKINANRDVVRAYGLFVLVTVVGFGAVLADWSSGYVLDPVNNLTAQSSAFLINIFGGDARAFGNRLSVPQGSVAIAEGCNAVYVIILYVAAVVAFPTTLKKKLIGVVFGSLALSVINLSRVITLLYLSGYNFRLFEEAHLHVWQFIIILLGGLVWVLWYDKIVRRSSHETDIHVSN